MILAALILEAFTFRCQLQSRWPSHPASINRDSIQFLVQDNESVRDSPAASDQLGQRPLSLPVLRPGDRSPVTKGSRESVPRAPYICCSGCFWFGKGPVYLALSFHDGGSDDATFSLNGIPLENRAYRAKTPWVSKPDYSGPILIRGRRLDGKSGNQLRFSASGPKPNDRLLLDSPSAGKEPTHWSFWPTSMYVPRPGCYGLQVDTLQGTDLWFLAQPRRLDQDVFQDGDR
jgi:hypothetical protein